MKSQKVSNVLEFFAIMVWLLFGFSWFMSYSSSLADVFPASHFWWILLAGTILHSFSWGYRQPSFTKTVWLDKNSEEEGVHGKYPDENGNWVDSESKYKEIPVSQKVLVVSGLKNMLFVSVCVAVVVAVVVGLAILGDDGCLEYYSGYDTGWSEVCVVYESYGG